MAIGLRGVTTNTGAGFGAATYSIAPPSGSTSGDLGVLVIVQAKEGTTAAATPSGWTLRGSSTTNSATGSGGVASVFTKSLGAGEGNVSITSTGTACVYYYSFTGADLSAPLSNGPTFGQPAASPVTITSFTPPSGAAAVVVYGFLQGTGAPTMTTPTGWTAAAATRVGNYENANSFYDLTFDGSTATGTVSVTPATNTPTYPARTVALAVKAAVTTIPVATSDSGAGSDSSDSYPSVKIPPGSTIKTDWRKRPAGQVLGTGAGATADDGGTFLNSPTAAGISATVTTHNGVNGLEVTWPDTNGNALYVQESVAGKVNKIGATFGFGSNSPGQSICLATWDTPTVGSSTNAQCHFVTTPTGWQYSVGVTGVLTQIAQGFHTLNTNFEQYHVAVNIIGNTAYLDLPDGSVTTVTDSRIGSIQGYQACWEYFKASGTGVVAAPITFYEMHAGPYAAQKPLPTTVDTGNLTDSSSLVSSSSLSTSDVATSTDASSISTTQYLSRTDSAASSETSRVNIGTSDSAISSETSSLFQGSASTGMDTGTGTETSATTSSRTTTESGTVTDSSTVVAAAILSTSDTAATTETSNSGASLSSTESATSSETTSLFTGQILSTTDNSTSSETSAYTSAGSTADAASSIETSSILVTYTRTDSAASTETSASGTNSTRTDTANATDASTPINSADQYASTETGTLAETTSSTVTSQTSDSSALTDTSSATTTTTRTDANALVGETSQINQTRTDTGTPTETSRVGQTRTDANTSTSETSRINQTLSDQANVTDVSNPIAIIARDNAVATDTKTGSGAAITGSESGVFIEGASMLNRPISSPDGDSGTFIDEAQVYELPRVTEDTIYYPQKDIYNRSFRIIAQDHFTREFIHWDLPVDNLQVTFSLSGPNLLVAQLSSEMDSIMSLDPPLMPNRTWLHLEEDGDIRASFILTPFIDYPGSQVRQIEAEGFSGYPHWIYYEGPSYTGIQVDPADMIRKLWGHVQGYTDGNLGVQVSQTKTPVKIGEPPENIAFTTSENVNVSFQAGPYVLNYWTVTNVGDEIDKLCKETPLEFIEFSYWNENKTDVIHSLSMGYPRVGGRRRDLVFREGENLTQLLPSYQGTNDNYASEVIVIGAGTGAASIRATASGRIGLLRKTNVIQNQDIYKKDRAQAIANFEFNRIAHSRFLIEYITVDLTHPNSLWGTFIPGDDIQVEATVTYVGLIKDWYRIVSYDYDPYQKTATIYLSPSDSFTYGAENISPYDQLPTAGYASLASQQDFSQLFQTNQQTRPLSQLQAYQIQAAQKTGCDVFNKKGLKNGECIFWYWLNDQPVASNAGFPTIAYYIADLSYLASPLYTMIIGKTSYGHILTGENIVLYATDGTIGQPQNSEGDIAIPNPYYIPDADTSPDEPSLEQQAAKLILARIRSGLPINRDWSWNGAPFLVEQFNITLYLKYSGYKNMSAQQFLSAVIMGQIQ